MFKLADPEKTYRTPATIEVPADDNQTEPHVFHCDFVVLDADAMQTLMDAPDDLQFCRTVLRGWSDVQDHAGKNLKFTDENLVKLTKIPYFSRGVVNSYMAWWRGELRKN